LLGKIEKTAIIIQNKTAVWHTVKAATHTSKLVGN